MSVRTTLTLMVLSGLSSVYFLGICQFVRADESAAHETQAGKPSIPATLTPSFRMMNERLSREVTPHSNCVTELLEVMGTNFLQSPLKPMTLAMLGLSPTTGQKPVLVYPQVFLQQVAEEKKQTYDQAEQAFFIELRQAADRPWTADPSTNTDPFPVIREYLDVNVSALDRLREASARPHYYAPVLSEDVPPRMLSASWAVERQLGLAARLLIVRAMRSAGAKDLERASDDLLAVHRWAVRLATGSPFDVSVAKAQVLDAEACHATYALAEAGLWTAAAAKRHRSLLKAIGELPPASRACDMGERAIVHEELELLKTDPASVAGFFELPADAPPRKPDELSLKEIDWKLAHQSADGVFDLVVEALRKTDREEQSQAFKKLADVEAAWKKTDAAYSAGFPQELREDVLAASRWVGESMAMSLLPNYFQRQQSDDRARSRRVVVDTVLALSIVIVEQQRFPERLEEIVPDQLPEIPQDVHSGEPLVYERLADGTWRVGSRGPNRRNDDGSRYNDDLLIRLTLPASTAVQK